MSRVTARSPERSMLKANIKSYIESYLYSKPQRIYRQGLVDIIVRHACLVGNGVRGFRYKSKVYQDESKVPNRNAFKPLHKSLVNDMNRLLSVWDPVLLEEKQLVLALISSILNTSEYPGEYLTRMPEALTPCIKEICKILKLDQLVPCTAPLLVTDNNKRAMEMLHYRITANLLLE